MAVHLFLVIAAILLLAIEALGGSSPHVKPGWAGLTLFVLSTQV